ncbi:MAG: Uma2 family endonuclease [Gemmatimonadales bacterium]
MPAFALHQRWTRAEVRALIDDAPLATPRYELVDGELLVSPTPRYAHQEVVARLMGALRPYLAMNPVGRALHAPFEIDLEDESLVQPDVFVLPSSEVRRLNVAEWRPAESLLLAIEVLSPSSARHDRRTKRALYQRHVPEYWIVDIDARLIERWRRGDERPDIVSTTLIWSPDGAAQPLAIEIDALFADLAAADDKSTGEPQR